MGSEYAKKRPGIQSSAGSGGGYSAPERSFPNSARLDALKSGAMKPSAADKGQQFDLKAAMRERMEKTFGADFSKVKTYESQTVADAGAEAVAQGNEIAFAPGKTDFSSQSGQALLGHELSHVASQSRGEVTGGGFLSDSALEARADREGSLAARGGTVYGGDSALNGGAVMPLSSASAAPMQGPMQASKPKDAKAEEQARQKAYMKKASKLAKLQNKQDKLKARNKDLSGRDWRNYMSLQTEAEEGGGLYKALLLKRNEKRRKEMQMGPGSNYHSQDRYDSAINQVRRDANYLYDHDYDDDAFQKHLKPIWNAESAVESELGDDYVWDYKFEDFRKKRDGGDD